MVKICPRCGEVISLTEHEKRILATLKEQGGSAKSILSLQGDEFYATTNRVVKRLEEKGLVEKLVKMTGKRKAYEIFLTDKGEKALSAEWLQ